MKYNSKTESELRYLIYSSFWKFNKKNRKDCLQALEKQLAYSPKEAFQKEKVLDENGKEVFISVPKAYRLIIREDGKDSPYVIGNYYAKDNKAYQLQIVKYEDENSTFTVSPKGIIKCKKTLTREFDVSLPDRVATVIKVKAHDMLNEAASEYLKVVNSSGNDDKKQECIEEINKQGRKIDAYDKLTKITIKQEIILEDKELYLKTKVYSLDGLVNDFKGYEYDEEEKCYVKTTPINTQTTLDFNIVLDEIEDALDIYIEKPDIDYPKTALSFLSEDGDRINKLLSFYESLYSITFDRGIYVVNRPPQDKLKKKKRRN